MNKTVWNKLHSKPPVIKMGFNNSIAFYFQGKSILYNHTISISRRSRITLNENLISVCEEVNKREALVFKHTTSFLILIVQLRNLHR